MKVRYHRVSTHHQTAGRLETDKEKYDIEFFEKISGKVNFKDRPKAKELIKIIEQKKVSELHVIELSRLGRNTADVLTTLEWLEKKEINVVIKNIGLETMPQGVKNPIAKLLTGILASIYELERQNIMERSAQGITAYLARGGTLGRKKGSTISDAHFMAKLTSKKCLELLRKGRTIRECAKICDISTRTVQKVKKIADKLEK
ncbi:Site-specific DNA recombinase [Chryseobacterium oranimense]|uniref:Site-specific DNA recombinase n=1 Tax=Chryseobacterium oranimense TaxID=421058 RepID=A0A1M5X459_9FLAO|nr:recombinase family protein [Chryseobacterium oranimense]SHH94589.1 Site-specific DNA recombinase [Chryseobacterium oranimense]